MALILENISYRLITFYLAGSEKLLMGISNLGDSVVITAMILIYVFISDVKSVLFPDAKDDVFPKVILTSVAVSIPLYLSLFHLGLGINEFLYTVLWPIGTFLLSVDCFEVAGIFRRLKVNSWMLGTVGAAMILAISSFSIYYDISQHISGVFPIYSYYGESIAIPGSLLFLIPGVELYRKREMPELEGGGRENAAMMRFLNNLSEIVGGSASRAILEGTVSGFRERLNKDIVLREDMTVKLDKDWEDFYEFLLATAYQCVGPIAFECSKGISELDRARSRVMEVFGWIPQQ